ncbi:MAG: hypothetical protein ACXWV2_05835 [Chitinophagaceae bacterium]
MNVHLADGGRIIAGVLLPSPVMGYLPFANRYFLVIRGSLYTIAENLQKIEYAVIALFFELLKKEPIRLPFSGLLVISLFTKQKGGIHAINR